MKAEPSSSSKRKANLDDQGQKQPNHSRSKLSDLYFKLCQSKEVKQKLAQVFKHVRIMVVGRSGSGKSTLIRLVVGENGPRSISNNTRGIQDITVEWRHPDANLPLVFHDSNGIDVEGNCRLQEIQDFLDAHQRSVDLSKRIHLVWYVVSATENRLADDGGLLQMLDTRHPNLPLLLVMTFNDDGEKVVRRNIDSPDSGFEMLLQRISDPSKRQRARDMMVRLGNDVRQMKDGSITGDRDVEGLKLLTQRTKDLMGEEFHATWIAAQVTDIYAKLDKSVECIIDHKRSEEWTTYGVGALPVAQQVQLGRTLLTVGKSLCKIWGVPRSMEEAICTELLMKQGIKKGVVQNMVYDLGVGMVLAAVVVGMIITAGAGAAALIPLYGICAYNQAKGASALIMSISVLVLGIILHVKATDQPWSSWHHLDHLHSVEHYLDLCVRFLGSDQGKKVQSFVENHSASWTRDPLQRSEEIHRLKAQLLSFFQDNLEKANYRY